MNTVQFFVPSASYPRYNGDSSWYTAFGYPAGEMQVRLTTDGIKAVKNADTVQLITNGVPNVMVLLLLADAIDELILRQYPKTELELYMPYLPYSRADRRFVEGDCDGLGVFSSIIDLSIYSRIVTLDAHSPVTKRRIQGIENISPQPLIDKIIKGFPPGSIIQRLLPDKGASRYDIKAPYCTKDRDPQTGKLSGFTVPEEALDGASDILIIDDICDGGGTFVGIAKEIRKMGWKGDLYLYTTHGIYSKGFHELLIYFKHLYCSDSFTQPKQLQDEGKLTVYPALPLMVGE